MGVFDSEPEDLLCPKCGYRHIFNVEAQDELLKKEAVAVKAARKKAGIDRAMKGLVGIVLRVEEGTLAESVRELSGTTPLEHTGSFIHGGYSTAIMEAENTPAFIVRESAVPSPFQSLNIGPRTKDKPNTRLETFIFETTDIEHVVREQRNRGAAFMTDIIPMGGHKFAQTRPSPNTNNTVAYVQFDGEPSFKPGKAKPGIRVIPKPETEHVRGIGFLDHAATRITHMDRAPAILEWMGLTGYDFSEAIYARLFNSITNVTRLKGKDFAMVLTSGIKPYTGDPNLSEPTEKFVRNYGKRVHHLAWQADPIETVFEGLKADGMGFLLDLVGDRSEGLKQTFSKPSKNTFLVQEYIHRYDDFDGFFTKSNVTKLTEATDWQ
jgi:hypothetical protein